MLVLIIDDDPISMEILKLRLHQLDVSTLEAFSVLECKKLLKENLLPDAIFLDLYLPIEDGFDFLSYRSTQTDLLSIPVIVMSGAADLKTISKAIDKGADSYLIKPVQTRLLIEELKKIGLRVL